MLVVLFAAAPCGAGADPVRNDYADPVFDRTMATALRAFYERDFTAAARGFADALARIPDNTLAMTFENATAMQTPGAIDALVSAEEAALEQHPQDPLTHVRLGFTYLFQSETGVDRDADARDEFDTAARLDPRGPAAHVGLGIIREGQRSANRAKVELLTALAADPNNILAREYLALVYQVDLREPQRALAYVIDIPNVLPEYADIDYHIASLFDDLHQPQPAIAYATRGLEIDIGHVGEAGVHGFTLLAQIYLAENKPGDARRVLRASIAANVDTDFAQALLHKMEIGSK
jgi:Tfp pilus assembly protein PilF